MTASNDLLAGQVALITGAGRGLGRQIALAFARAGADIVATARTKAQVEDTIGEIKALSRRALSIVTDVTQEDQVRAMADQQFPLLAARFTSTWHKNLKSSKPM